MDRVKVTVLAVFLGVLYAYLSVYIIGFGAAIAIPESILTPIAKVAPILAFAMVDLITIGLPLIVIYFLFVLGVKYLNASKSYLPYLALFAPFFIQHIYFFVIMGQPQDWVYTLATILPRYIAILAFAYYFARRAVNQTKA